jgi:hypothetical protein
VADQPYVAHLSILSDGHKLLCFLVSDSTEEYKGPSYVPQFTDVHIMYINF